MDENNQFNNETVSEENVNNTEAVEEAAMETAKGATVTAETATKADYYTLD